MNKYNLQDMIADGFSVSCMYETIKAVMCDQYCKYPAQYEVSKDDINYEKMINAVCEHCPLNVL